MALIGARLEGVWGGRKGNVWEGDGNDGLCGGGREGGDYIMLVNCYQK